MAKPFQQPFRGFLDLMGQMDRMRTLARTGASLEAVPRTEETAWVPTTDVYARGSDLVIAIELAGVPASAIDIGVSQGVLTVSGERTTEPPPVPGAERSHAAAVVQERYSGYFRRSFMLPAGVDEERISATFDLGLLVITVPDAADVRTPRTRRINLEEARPA